MTSLRDLAELVRAPAALSVPGDAVAGATAARVLDRRTAVLAGASVCLYWAGMAANDWADRAVDAAERPARPIPSGRVRPAVAVGLAAGLTVAGVTFAAAAGGRRSLLVAGALAGMLWTYDLKAKQTAAGPAVMAACRGLDVLLGASTGRIGRAVPAAAAVAAHTYSLSLLSRREMAGADALLPAATLMMTAAVASVAGRPASARTPGLTGGRTAGRVRGLNGGPLRGGAADRAPTALAGWYAARYGRAQVRAAADPRPEHIRAAVAAGITGLPALQGALVARAGAPLAGLLVAAAAVPGAALARRVSPT